MIGSFPVAIPPPKTPFVSVDQTLTKDARYLLITLVNRTGGGTGLSSVGLGLISAGTNQGNAFLLVSDWNSVDTVASGTGVVMPVLAVGADCIIWNNGTNPLKIYPPSGSAIDALLSNAAYSLPATKMQWFRCVSPTLIRSMQLG